MQVVESAIDSSLLLCILIALPKCNNSQFFSFFSLFNPKSKLFSGTIVRL